MPTSRSSPSGSRLPDPLEDELTDLFLRSSAGREERLSLLLAESGELEPAVRARISELRRAETGSADPTRSGAAGGGLPGPAEVGAYGLLEVLGRGGMGTVYLAQRRGSGERRVALKLLTGGSREVLARFEFERQSLALMTHPSIAQVFDAGISASGQPYFVMEYVEGCSLTEYCDRKRLPLDDRIAVFQKVCHGVQHAHRRGVLHRDLKPGNILARDSGGKPIVKIIDFGLARALDDRMAGDSVHTMHGQLLGTPEYMSPEQAAGDAERIDTRTDIYALGVVLFELLAGALPLGRGGLRSGSTREIQRRILEADPPKPSARVAQDADASVALARRTTCASLRRRLAGDLDWIVMRAMAKEPERRYQSPLDLALDLDRYLADVPVLAGPPSWTYRMRKLARRHRGRVAGAALVFLSLLLGGITAAVQYRRAEENARRSAFLAHEKGELAAAEQAAREEAQASERLARANAGKLASKVEEFDQLAGVVLLEQVLASEAELYPAWPARIDAMESWLGGGVSKLRSMVPTLARTVANLERDGPAKLKSQGFLRDTLVELLEGIESLDDGVYARVQGRLSWAKRLRDEGLSRAHPNARTSWDAVRQAIASNPRYAGCAIELAPGDVMDLVPIGCNPVTGYWEFYHLPSAWDGVSDPAGLSIPEHRADGSLGESEHMGIVFVLLPGGRARLGSQNEDPGAPNFDPERDPEEHLRSVELAPFYLARHELTQGQWERLWRWDAARRTPSRYRAGKRIAGQPIVRTNPVEMVDWTMSSMLVRRYGLELPTEAQWEYGCRAGSTTPFQVRPERLVQVANVADAAGKRAYPAWSCDPWEDGYVLHAPVGSFAFNAFGLYDMHGNVWEWCRDWYFEYGRNRAGDGRNEGQEAAYRCYRGGGARLPAIYARSAHRDYNVPTYRNATLGLRPARALHPGV